MDRQIVLRARQCLAEVFVEVVQELQDDLFREGWDAGVGEPHVAEPGVLLHERVHQHGARRWPDVTGPVASPDKVAERSRVQRRVQRWGSWLASARGVQRQRACREVHRDDPE